MSSNTKSKSYTLQTIENANSLLGRNSQRQKNKEKHLGQLLVEAILQKAQEFTLVNSVSKNPDPQPV